MGRGPIPSPSRKALHESAHSNGRRSTAKRKDGACADASATWASGGAAQLLRGLVLFGLIVCIGAFWVLVFVVFFLANDVRLGDLSGRRRTESPQPLGIWLEASAESDELVCVEVRYLEPENGSTREWIRQTRRRDRKSGQVLSVEPDERIERKLLPRSDEK